MAGGYETDESRLRKARGRASMLQGATSGDLKGVANVCRQSLARRGSDDEETMGKWLLAFVEREMARKEQTEVPADVAMQEPVDEQADTPPVLMPDVKNGESED